MRINAYGFYYEKTTELTPASVTFNGSEVDLEGAGIEANFTPHVIEQMNAKSREPRQRIDLGIGQEFLITVAKSDLALLGLMVNEDVSTNKITISATKTPVALDLYAIRFKTDVPEEATNKVETYIATGLNFTGDQSLAFNASDDGQYIQLRAVSTADSKLEIAQSAS